MESKTRADNRTTLINNIALLLNCAQSHPSPENFCNQLGMVVQAAKKVYGADEVFAGIEHNIQKPVEEVTAI